MTPKEKRTLPKIKVRVLEEWSQCVHCKRTYLDCRKHCFYCEKDTAQCSKWSTKVVPECVAKLASLTGRTLKIVKN